MLVNGHCQPLCYISPLLRAPWDECEGLLCMYVVADSLDFFSRNVNKTSCL